MRLYIQGPDNDLIAASVGRDGQCENVENDDRFNTPRSSSNLPLQFSSRRLEDGENWSGSSIGTIQTRLRTRTPYLED